MGNQSEPCSKQEFIVAQWLRLGGKAIGRRELRRIQRALHEKFGEGGVESPATIARVLADEGAQLRHPEVIEFDARWREARIINNANALEITNSEKPWRLKQAVTVIKKLEKLRLRFEQTNEVSAMRGLR